ncbi:L-aspartate oxidase [Roseixanthobacter pseudopolyaromaticivorans]|uniref:L-aspartate oxidase n=1 Tax=Xanthobacteraceae TaxID=335928 RepID=UPI00372B7A24
MAQAAGRDADRVIVVGAGVAGIACALALAPLKVLVVAPQGVAAVPATAMAQGGIAAALGVDDHPDLHTQDTLKAGAGLTRPDAAARVTGAAASVIARLADWGVAFDTDAAGAVALGLEAAHSRNRIVHADGDATGRAVLDALIARARISPHISRRTDLKAIDLLRDAEGRVTGVRCMGTNGAGMDLMGRAVVLATGGLGGLYASTTNPRAALGSGLALAARAGAVLRDIEFVQFHPTAIAATRDPMPLATEALRGEGAILFNDQGERFMADVAGAELAPRDVVARAIHAQIVAGRRVTLDARACLGDRFAARFPSVHALCLESGIDPAREAIPVRPAAHYHMGGVKVDAHGRTSVPGLYACGEVASTGLHGANRLASNSLLEAIAFSGWISAAIAGEAARDAGGATAPVRTPKPALNIEALRRIMDRHVGVVRSAAGLGEALRALAPHADHDDAALVASLVALSALKREESRGGHFRADHPAPEPHGRHCEIDLAQIEAALAPWRTEPAFKEAV